METLHANKSWAAMAHNRRLRYLHMVPVKYRPNAARLKVKHYVSVNAHVHISICTYMKGVACKTRSRHGQRSHIAKLQALDCL